LFNASLEAVSRHPINLAGTDQIDEKALIRAAVALDMFSPPLDRRARRAQRSLDGWARKVKAGLKAGPPISWPASGSHDPSGRIELGCTWRLQKLATPER